MITQKTARHVLRAQAEINEALRSNRLKGWEVMPLNTIKAKLDKFVDDNGLTREK